MAYPSPASSGASRFGAHGTLPASRSVSGSATGLPRCQSGERSLPEGEHQREKLQFALAVALTRGDLTRSQQLRDQIAALGGDLEEPGT
jgi:hypothetical protein